MNFSLQVWRILQRFLLWGKKHSRLYIHLSCLFLIFVPICKWILHFNNWSLQTGFVEKLRKCFCAQFPLHSGYCCSSRLCRAVLWSKAKLGPTAQTILHISSSRNFCSKNHIYCWTLMAASVRKFPRHLLMKSKTLAKGNSLNLLSNMCLPLRFSTSEGVWKGCNWWLMVSGVTWSEPVGSLGNGDLPFSALGKIERQPVSHWLQVATPLGC